MLGALEHFLVDAARREGAQKRGGGCRFVFLDADAAKNDYQLSAPASQTPERLFEARWAAAVVGAAFARLREELTVAGKGAFYEALKDFVAGEKEASYQQAADALELSLPALKSAIRRLRLRYAALLREEVAHTVAVGPGEVEAEMRDLCAALRAG